MAEGAEGVAAELIVRLEQAWNEADGRAFGEPFAPDADFVDIRGEHHRGRAPGHLRFGLQGQHHRLRAEGARELSEEVIVAHATGELRAP